MKARCKWLAALLTLALLAGVLPTRAWALAVNYPIWVGNTQVTSDNMDNILGDGSAWLDISADGKTAHLFLNDPKISAINEDRAVIAADAFGPLPGFPENGGFDLVLHGRADLCVAGAERGIHVSGGTLTIDGSFITEGTMYGLMTTGNLVVASGSLQSTAAGHETYHESDYGPYTTWTGTGIYVEGDLRLTGGNLNTIAPHPGMSIGLYVQGDAALTGGGLDSRGYTRGADIGGSLTIGKGISRVYFRASQSYAASAYGQISVDPLLEYKAPEDATLAQYAAVDLTDDGTGFVTPTGRNAHIAELTSCSYPIYVGGVRVTKSNRHDVLDDGGSVQFTPAPDGKSGTLTLNNPSFDGLTLGATGPNAVILVSPNRLEEERDFPLTIEGNATLSMPEAAYYGIRAKGSGSHITLSGDIHTEGSESAILIDGNLTVSGGKLTAVTRKVEAIYTAGRFFLTGGLVYARSNGGDLLSRSAISCLGGLELTGGRLEAESTSGDGIVSPMSDITIGSGVEYVKAVAADGHRAMLAAPLKGILLDSTLVITTPDGGQLDNIGNSIVARNGNITNIAVIEPYEALFRTVIWLDGDGSELERIRYSRDDAEPTTDKLPQSAEPDEVFDRWDDGAVEGYVKTYRPIFKSALAPIVVTGIQLNSSGAKKAYIQGEALDVAGLTLEVTKSDGSRETVNVTAAMVSGFDGSTVGKQTLTVTYGGFSDTYQVEITAKAAPRYEARDAAGYAVQSLTWQKGSSVGLDITVSRSEADELTRGLFTSLEIGSRVVDAAHYTAAEGSLKLSILPAYLETLSVGSHTVRVVFADGSARVELRITAAPTEPDPGPVSPKTGDNASPALWLGMAGASLLSLLAAAAVASRRKAGR